MSTYSGEDPPASCGNMLGDELAWDEDAGFHHRRSVARATPWFFSGILTGQRALDNHSFKRLRWHVRRALASSRRGT